MKFLLFKDFRTITFILGVVILISPFACNPKSEKSNATVFEEKPITPVVKPEITDSSTKTTTTRESELKEETKPQPKATPKTCQPNFTLIGKPKSTRYLYYVTGFNPGEFKCWAELEAHGAQICKGEPCVIYYLDTPKAAITSVAPYYVDPAILKDHGFGQFEHTNHWWEVKGAKIWGRPGKEFVYYNTNNNAGG